MKGHLADNVSVKTITDTENIIKATISEEKQSKLFDLLQNPYSNAIGSIVREITSNCIDSHVEAGCLDKAVVITLDQDEAGKFISFEDFGVGMDETFIRNRYSKYLDSTKEDSNDQIGYFGIGSKSPLSYTSQFFLTSIRDGIEYQYIVRKDDDGIPVVQKLVSMETTKDNGTKVFFYIDNDDISKFVENITDQLTYFNNVYIDDKLKNYNTKELPSNEYIIFEGKTFKLRHDNVNNFTFNVGTQNGLHLVIQNVKYAIDWKQLNIPEIKIDIGLKFSIGELNVTMTRENIKYTKQTVILIKSRISELYDELLALSKKGKFVDSYKKAISDINKINLPFDKYTAILQRTYSNKFSAESFGNQTSLVKDSHLHTTQFSGLNNFLERWPHLIPYTGELFGVYYISDSSTSKASNFFDIIELLLDSNRSKTEAIFRIAGQTSHKKNQYIQSILLSSYFYLIKQSKLSLKLFKKKNLLGIPRSRYREFITDYLTETEKFFVETTHLYEDIKIPHQWFIDNKESDSKSSLKNPFGVDKAMRLRYIELTDSYKFESNRYEVSLERFLTTYKNRHILLLPYTTGEGSKNQKMQLNRLFMNSRFHIIYTSKTNIELLKTFDVFYTMDTLQTTHSKIIGNIATVMFIGQLFNKVGLSNTLDDVRTRLRSVENVIPEWKDRFNSLQKFIESNQDYYGRISRITEHNTNFGTAGEEIITLIVKNAIDNGTLNTKQIETAEFICKLIHRYGLDFIEHNMSAKDMVALDIASKNPRILPFSYYRDFIIDVRRKKESPNTCSVLGLALSFIQTKLIDNTSLI